MITEEIFNSWSEEVKKEVGCAYDFVAQGFCDEAKKAGIDIEDFDWLDDGSLDREFQLTPDGFSKLRAALPKFSEAVFVAEDNGEGDVYWIVPQYLLIELAFEMAEYVRVNCNESEPVPA